jgi:hypothetical protein
MNKQYFYDNREERLKYNYEYWSVNGHKYIERKKERKNDTIKILKLEQIFLFF